MAQSPYRAASSRTAHPLALSRLPPAAVDAAIAGIGAFVLVDPSGVAARDPSRLAVVGLCAAGASLVGLASRLRSPPFTAGLAASASLFVLFKPAGVDELFRSLDLVALVLLSLVVRVRWGAAVRARDETVRAAAVAAGWLAAVGVGALILGHDRRPPTAAFAVALGISAWVVASDVRTTMWLRAVRLARVPGWFASARPTGAEEEPSRAIEGATLLVYPASIPWVRLAVFRNGILGEGSSEGPLVAPEGTLGGLAASFTGILWGFLRGACGVMSAVLLLVLFLAMAMDTGTPSRPTPSPTVTSSAAGGASHSRP
ncbi:MAG: hypothetical protein ABSE49_35445 [Polyangiaceae bacterium]|jgi:hypothetical protein